MGKLSTTEIFNMTDFRTYVLNWVKLKGRGEYRRIALALNVHTTLISQVFNNKKCLTEEQAAQLANYMGLNDLESDYLIKLVQIERAGNEPLRNQFKRHLRQLQQQSNEVKSQVSETKNLTEQDRAIFYSSWQYSLVRLVITIPSFRTKEGIAAYLGLSLSRTEEILNFLISRGLCEENNGVLRRTEKNTHVDSKSPLALRHHQNWRLKSMALQEKMTTEDLSFTSPVSLSKSDFKKVRRVLLNTISEIAKVVDESKSEEVVYLGIDWLRL